MSRLSRGKQKLQQAFLRGQTPPDSNIVRMPMRKSQGEPSNG